MRRFPVERGILLGRFLSLFCRLLATTGHLAVLHGFLPGLYIDQHVGRALVENSSQSASLVCARVSVYAWTEEALEKAQTLLFYEAEVFWVEL